MFQSVAPRPGKVAFEIEPFPVPAFQVLPEDSKVTLLPVAEPVAVPPALEEPVAEEPEAINNPLSLVVDVEEENEVVVDEVVVVEELAPEIPAEEEPNEALAEELPEEKFDDEVIAEETIALEEVDPFAAVEEEASPQIESVLELVPDEQPNPFDVSEKSEDIFASPDSEVEEEAVVENSVEETPVEEDLVDEGSGTEQSSTVTSWQPPVAKGKKKSTKTKRKGLFRR